MKNKSEHEHRRQNIGQAHTTIPPQKYVTSKFDVLVLQNSIVVVQNNSKERQKVCGMCKFVFLLIRKKVCCMCNLFFC